MKPEVDTEAPTVPTNVRAENITENSADISWEASTDNVGVVAYEIYNDDVLLTTITEGTSTRLNELTAETEYNLSIKAVDAAGNKSEAGTVSFKTEEMKPEVDTEAPTVPTNIKAENITENSADISWEASTDNVGVVSYEVYNGDKLLITVKDKTSIKISDLKADTKYDLSIKAIDAAGNKSEAGTVSFKTEEIKPEVDTEAPTAPKDIKVEKITENSVYISWKESTDNVGVVAYEVYNGDKLLVTVKDKTSVKISDLKAGTKYNLSIKAVDAAGNKSEAGTISFTTKKISTRPNNGGKLPQTGGMSPIVASSISMIAITLGTIVLKKKKNK